MPMMQVIQQMQQQQQQQGSEREATLLGGPDTKDSFLPTESIRPTESLIPTESWDSGPNGNLSLLGTSDALAPTAFFLV